MPHFGIARRPENLDNRVNEATEQPRIRVGNRRYQTYAVYLLERFKAGDTPEELALSEGIPVERITLRLAVAAEFARKHPANVTVSRRRTRTLKWRSSRGFTGRRVPSNILCDSWMLVSV